MTEAFKLDPIGQAESTTDQTDVRLVTELMEIAEGERVLAALREGASWVKDYRDIEANGGRPRYYRVIPLAGSVTLKSIS